MRATWYKPDSTMSRPIYCTFQGADCQKGKACWVRGSWILKWISANSRVSGLDMTLALFPIRDPDRSLLRGKNPASAIDACASFLKQFPCRAQLRSTLLPLRPAKQLLLSFAPAPCPTSLLLLPTYQASNIFPPNPATLSHMLRLYSCAYIFPRLFHFRLKPSSPVYQVN